MANVYLICGKICCGKSTYADGLRKEKHAVLLSCDEIMLALFDPYLGDTYDTVSARAQEYLFRKSVQIIETGIDVILDWGFWTKESRAYARAFYQTHGIETEFHYLEIADEVWQARISKRNEEVAAGKTSAYVVDEGLAKKFESRFERPSTEEIDVWINADKN